jgi:hypothetical protein
MCDYSLEMYGSRPAREGETYVATRFPSGSVGFASPGDPRTAVCVACDTVLLLSEIPKTLQETCGIGAREQVTFVRLEEGLHRDGVRFDNGKSISLQQLKPGVAATIVKQKIPADMVDLLMAREHAIETEPV